MSREAADFCQKISFDIAKHDARAIVKELTILNKAFTARQPQVLRGATNDGLFPTADDLSQFSDIWRPIIVHFFNVMYSIREKNKVEAYVNGNELLKAMNRCAERENDWILPVLKTIVKDLKFLAISADVELEAKQKRDRNQLSKRNMSFDNEDTDMEEEKYIEQASRTINKSFTICLNDRDLDFGHNKKKAVYFFIAELYHIYFKLNKYDLAKSVQRALNYKINELPSIDAVPKASAVAYLYYSGCLYASDGNLIKAQEHFSQALLLTGQHMDKHQQSILLMLIPINFYIKKLLPSEYVFTTFPKINRLYYQIFKAIKQGNLKKFNREIKKIEKFLLKKNLYLVFQQIRQLLIWRLYKKTFLLAKQLPELFTNVHQLPISALAKALDFSTNHLADIKKLEQNHKLGINMLDPDLTECHLANLIFLGYIKGYISHTNGVVVLSKKDPFPKQVQL